MRDRLYCERKRTVCTRIVSTGLGGRLDRNVPAGALPSWRGSNDEGLRSTGAAASAGLWPRPSFKLERSVRAGPREQLPARPGAGPERLHALRLPLKRPLWVINGHRMTFVPRPLYPRKRTRGSSSGASALGQQLPHAPQQIRSLFDHRDRDRAKERPPRGGLSEI